MTLSIEDFRKFVATYTQLLTHDANPTVAFQEQPPLPPTETLYGRLKVLIEGNHQQMRSAPDDGTSSMAQHLIDTALEKLTNPPSKLRQGAIQVLKNLNDPVVLLALVGALSDRNGDVVSDAFKVLQNSKKGPQVIEAIINKMLSDPFANTRYGAAMALQKATDDSVVSAFVAALSDQEAKVRAAAASGLTGTKDETALNALVRSLSDKKSEVRSAAAMALAGTTHQKTVADLFELIHPSKKGAKAVNAFEATKAFEGTKDPKVLKVLVDLLKGTNNEERQSAAFALQGTTDETAIKALVDALSDQTWFVRVGAARALTGTKDETAIKALIEKFHDDTHEVQIAAIKALKGTENQAALRALVQTLGRESTSEKAWEVKSAVAEALMGIKDQRTIDALIHVWSNVDHFGRVNAAKALKGTKSEKAIEYFVQVLSGSGKSSDTRSEAARILTGTTDQKAISTLVSILFFNHENASLRQACASALENITDPVALAFLTDCLLKKAGESAEGMTDADKARALVKLFSHHWYIPRVVARVLEGTMDLEVIDTVLNTWLSKKDGEEKDHELTSDLLTTILNSFLIKMAALRGRQEMSYPAAWQKPVSQFRGFDSQVLSGYLKDSKDLKPYSPELVALALASDYHSRSPIDGGIADQLLVKSGIDPKTLQDLHNTWTPGLAHLSTPLTGACLLMGLKMQAAGETMVSGLELLAKMTSELLAKGYGLNVTETTIKDEKIVMSVRDPEDNLASVRLDEISPDTLTLFNEREESDEVLTANLGLGYLMIGTLGATPLPVLQFAL